MSLTDPTEAALLRAILDNPADDLPRLVLADWLEEHGQAERAEFLRVQVAASRLHGGRKFPPLSDEMLEALGELRPLRERMRELRRTPGACDLDAALFDARLFTWEAWDDRPHLRQARLDRGFVSEVRCTLAEWAGGPCERCRPGGWNLSDGGYFACPACSGTGTTPGIGPRVVAEHPVETLLLSAGLEIEGDESHGYFWGVRRRHHDDDINAGLLQHPIHPWLWGHGMCARPEEAERAAGEHFLAWAKSQNAQAVKYPTADFAPLFTPPTVEHSILNVPPIT